VTLPVYGVPDEQSDEAKRSSWTDAGASLPLMPNHAGSM
jgi:hypothetical protein